MQGKYITEPYVCTRNIVQTVFKLYPVAVFFRKGVCDAVVFNRMSKGIQENISQGDEAHVQMGPDRPCLSASSQSGSREEHHIILCE